MPIREYIRKQIATPQQGIIGQLIKYCLSGGCAFVVDFGLLWLCRDIIGLHYLVASAIGYTVGLCITYTLSVVWIFDEHRWQSRLGEFLLFAVIGILGLGLTQLCMWIFSTCVLGEEWYLVAKIITTIIVTIFNFVMKKVILFTNKTKL